MLLLYIRSSSVLFALSPVSLWLLLLQHRRLGLIPCYLVLVPGQVHSRGEAVEAIVEDVENRYRVTVRRCIPGQGEFSESMEAERVGAFAEGFLGLQGRQDLELRDRDDADGLGLLGRTVGNYRWLVQSLGRYWSCTVSAGAPALLCLGFACVRRVSLSYSGYLLRLLGDRGIPHMTEIEYRLVHRLG